MSSLNEFYKQERKRVFEPDPYFPQRVMARLKEQSRQESTVWETLLGATRPVLALGLALLFALAGVRFLLPVEPARGLVEAYFSSEVSTGESFLYTDSEATPSREVFEQLMVLESGQ